MKLSKIFSVIAVSTGLAVCAQSYAGTVSTDGSTSMEKLIGVMSESFMKVNPDITVTYNPTGSGSGIQAAEDERCDIGLSSRGLKADEQKTLEGTTLALDGIVMVVNNKNPIKDLSLEQIAKIYKGEVTNWKEMGGADAPIVLIGREAGSGTRDGFESVTKTKEKSKYRQELTSTGDVITTVSQNPNAIGYASLSAVSKKVKGLTVGGVKATEETVTAGSYKLQRPFVLVTKKGKALSADAQKFVDYTFSDAAKPLVDKAGVVSAK